MDAGRVDPGVTLEAIGPLAVPFNGLIELQRPITRGPRNPDHYLLHMLLTGGGLTRPTSDRKSPYSGRSTRPRDDSSRFGGRADHLSITAVSNACRSRLVHRVIVRAAFG